jgi:hypothetical protein
MTITPNTLTRWAGAAAVAAGLLFIGVNINHPALNADTINTTSVLVRDSLKVLMAALALAGITGMYLSQVRRNGVLGLIGYLVFSVGYLTILGTSFTAAYVLPTVADSNHAYVNDVTAAATNGHAVGDIGLLQQAISVEAAGYLLGGLLFGIALYRARVLARWAAALLALASVLSVALAVMPDAFYRFLSYPNGIAMIALGYSLWRVTRAAEAPVEASLETVAVDAHVSINAGAE